MKTSISIAASIALLSAFGSAQAGGDAAAGQAKAAICAGCHGADGNSTIPMYPKLAGQHEQYLVKAIKAYKSGDRKDPTMAPMAATLTSDADIENVAAYFASQTPK
jgi:cytochrome c553